MTRPLFVGLLELRRYLADRAELAFGIALPIALFALMYMTFSGGNSFNGTVHIVDSDGGAVTSEILSQLRTVDGLSVEVLDEDDAVAKLKRSAVLSVVVFPAGISEAVAAGDRPAVTVRRRGNGGQEGQIATSIVRTVTQQTVSELAARSAVRAAFSDQAIPEARVDEAFGDVLAESRARPAITVRSRAVGGSEEFVDRLLPGILVMFLMFAVTLGSQTIVEDRRIGTLERLATTRLTLGQLFAGKFIAGLLRATVQTLVLLSLGFVVLQVAGPGQYFQVLVFCLLVSSAVSAIGLAIGALATNRDQAIWASVVVTMFMTVFGGTFFPTSGGALDILSRITLNRYAIDAIDGMISGGESLGNQGLEAAVVAGTTIVALAIARWGFRASAR